MSADNKENEDNILFPINQGEQAKQASRNSLLARDVFRKIAELLKISVSKLKDKDCVELDDHRAHEAILIDGGRGTGKSSVLVNLQLYMDDEPELKNKLLILKPVDPTLLENGDDLFLNIIVAALIRNKEIKAALNKGDKKAEAFYEQLQKLGSALEGVQTQNTQYGLDKLRAFIGNHGIAEEVHALFHNALQLTGKTVIVLPIDDVDTSLQHAFENMEVVRKYLASPYVVPIISGDLDLYHDVTWRDFYGRIVKDHRTEVTAAKERSLSLSNEYQRKILPTHRRINVPHINEYLNQVDIFISEEKTKFVNLNNFRVWIESLLNERVNGFENSFLKLPIKSLREFSQFIFEFEELISCSFKNEIFWNTTGKLTRELITRIRLNEIYFDKNIESSKNFQFEIQALIPEWEKKLEKVFLKNENGGAAYLVINANLEWKKRIDLKKHDSKLAINIFDVDLFKPINHSLIKYKQFEKKNGFQSAWVKHLSAVVSDDTWLKNLPTESIIPYPLPELGVPCRIIDRQSESFSSALGHRNDTFNSQLELVIDLLCHSEYYSSKPVDLILSGRIFELIVTSLFSDISTNDIFLLINKSPFFSSPAIATTKTLNFTDSEKFSRSSEQLGELSFSDELIYKLSMLNSNGNELETNSATAKLAADINKWRLETGLTEMRNPHSWLIYNVMNKYFNQVNLDDSGITSFGSCKAERLTKKQIVEIAISSFNAIWGIFGSFELGPIFGTQEVPSSINTEIKGRDFRASNIYTKNIFPLISGQHSSKKKIKDNTNVSHIGSKSYTQALENHPLKNLVHHLSNQLRKEINIPILNEIARDIFKELHSGVPRNNDIIKNLNDFQGYYNNVIENFEIETKVKLSTISSSEIFQKYSKNDTSILEKLLMISAKKASSNDS